MSKIKILLITALTLGLGWAIRGHFGHEWGASWAGAMAGLAVLFASQRKDWAQRAPALACLSAIGWAVGGMMSYGIVVGYCRGVEFWNVAYGYTMLAVIGGLYGFMGGGFFGLGLETTETNRPNWAALLTEMVAGAWLFWGLLIYQLEWTMTPPRSELWAACLGAAVALAWHLHRNGFPHAMRVACYTAMGAGVGFAVGNFFQTMGTVSGVSYNWWNVMEFTLGFCGGLALAYAVVNQDWPQCTKPSRSGNWLALIILFLVIPLTNLVCAFNAEDFIRVAKGLNILNPEQHAALQFRLGWITILIFAIYSLVIWRQAQRHQTKLAGLYVPLLCFGLSLYFMLFGFIRKSMFYLGFSLKHSDTLYIPLFLLPVAMWLLHRSKDESALPINPPIQESWKRWVVILSGLMAIIVIITLISINSHDGLGNYHERF
jgi:hypothetical protein